MKRALIVILLLLGMLMPTIDVLAQVPVVPQPPVVVEPQPVVEWPDRFHGVKYNPDYDKKGGKAKVQFFAKELKDKAPQGGISEHDIYRIAFARLKWWCNVPGTGGLACRGPLDATQDTGFDLSPVNEKDAFADYGWDYRCQKWGEDFTPFWGVENPQYVMPACPGLPPLMPSGRWPLVKDSKGEYVPPMDVGIGAPEKGLIPPGGIYNGGGPGVQWVTENILAASLLIIPRMFWEATVQKSLIPIAEGLGRILVLLPNPATDNFPGMENVRELTKLFNEIGFWILGILLVIAIMANIFNFQAISNLVIRLILLTLALTFYDDLLGTFIDIIREISLAVLDMGEDEVTTIFPTMLMSLVPLPDVIWYAIGIIGGFIFFIIFVIKAIATIFLMLTYATGPLAIPLYMLDRTQGIVTWWVEQFIKCVMWNLVWAILLRVFGAFAGGVTFTGPDGVITTDSLGQGVWSVVMVIAFFGLLIMTPIMLHWKLNIHSAVSGSLRITASTVGTVGGGFGRAASSATRIFR